MNIKATNSLRLRTNLLVSIAVITLGAVLFISNYYAIGVVRSNTLTDVSHIMDLYVEQIDDAVDNADNYLAGLKDSLYLAELQTQKNDAEFYRYASLLKKDMDAAAQTYSYLDCLFVYQEERDLFYESRHYTLASEEFSVIR